MSNLEIILNTCWYISFTLYFTDQLYWKRKREDRFLKHIEAAKVKARVQLLTELREDFADRGIRLNFVESEE